jgi:hypothetical protein
MAPDAKMMAVPIRAAAVRMDAGVPVALFQTRRVGGGSNVIGRGHQYDVGRDGRFIINVDELESSGLVLAARPTIICAGSARGGR